MDVIPDGPIKGKQEITILWTVDFHFFRFQTEE